MKWLCMAGLLLLTGCVGYQTPQADFFARQAEFAADRERETVIIEQLDYEEACAHVTGVLMDMDCQLLEINSELGVISATPNYPWLSSPTAIYHHVPYRSCSGHRVTVSVLQRPDGAIAVRSSFNPQVPAANETFRTLLRKSISLQITKEAGP